MFGSTFCKSFSPTVFMLSVSFHAVTSRWGDWAVSLLSGWRRVQRGYVEAFGATLRLRGGG